MSDTGVPGTVSLHDKQLAFRTWGQPDEPAVYLVHGSAATAAWWDHIAPSLAAIGRRVVALDLSGHGNSTHLSPYSFAEWAAEVHAVVQGTSERDDPVLVGHSMGGSVCLRAAIEYGAELAGVIAIDTVVRELNDGDWLVQRARENRKTPVYPSREAALARFRTIPPTLSADPELLRHIAESSVRQVDDGWTWKFDIDAFGENSMQSFRLQPVACPMRLVRGDKGMVDEAMANEVAAGLGCPPALVIDDCGHHVLLDRPKELLEIVTDLIVEWQG